MTQGQQAEILSTVVRLTGILHKVAATADLRLATEFYRKVTGGPLSAANLVEIASASDQTIVQNYVEAWSHVVEQVFLAAETDAWRELLVPQESGFQFVELSMIAFWLGWFDSPRLSVTDVPIPPPMEEVGITAHAVAVGKIVTTYDARAALNYRALMEAAAPELQAAIIFWFLSVYLVSPRIGLTAQIEAHRQRAMDDFVAMHQTEQGAKIPPLINITTAAAFRSAYLMDDPSGFIATVVDHLIAGSHPRVAPKAWGIERRAVEGRYGAVLSAWSAHKAVYRCISPLLESVRSQDFRGFWFGGPKDRANAELAPEWQNDSIRLIAKPALSAATLRDAISTVRAERLDVLYFTEVGLSVPTRWLAAHRLAKSQVTGYGHPVTTGSPFMDYYIGGLDIEDRDEKYRERLIVIPGLGVDTAAPPLPSEGLQRFTDGVLRIVSLASFDKLNSKMLGAWGEILRSTPGRVEFHLFPSAPVNLRRDIKLVLEQNLPADVLHIHYDAERQLCIDTLAQADLYLDSYPFGGYNTVIEALSVGCPIVTYKGRWPYQRVAASMVEKLGLANALVVSNWSEYVQTAKRLCADAEERRAYHQALTRTRIIDHFCNTDAGAHFAAAFEWISKNGPTKGPPMVIAAGEAPKALV